MPLIIFTFLFSMVSLNDGNRTSWLFVLSISPKDILKSLFSEIAFIVLSIDFLKLSVSLAFLCIIQEQRLSQEN